MTAAISLQQSATELTDTLWVRYRTDGDAEARTQLLDRYVGLVYHVAHEIARRTSSVEVDDLVSAGTFGLIKALDSFDVARGLAFSTYAFRRIRGAMLDDLRTRDWAPRSVRAKNRRLASMVTELQNRLGRAPRAREVAAELSIPMAEYWEWRGGTERGTTIPLDGTATTGMQTAFTLEETIENPDAVLPGDALADDERADGLKVAIARLPEKERTVLALYYYEELNLRQIAEVLQVTESRVSQIRAKALKRLRDHLGHAERV